MHALRQGRSGRGNALDDIRRGRLARHTQLSIIALPVLAAVLLTACSPTADLPTLDDVQAMFPDETLSVQVLPPPGSPTRRTC